MDLTESYKDVIPDKVLERYAFVEVRNAALILQATNSDEWDDLITVLDEFELDEETLMAPGGNKSKISKWLDNRLRELGWRETRVDTRISLRALVQPWKPGGEKKPIVRETTVDNEGYKADNVKGRMAIEVEWNAKDGNLDRDIGAARALYEAGLLDGLVIICRNQDLREVALEIDPDTSKYDTTTTTSLQKLAPRLTRGSAGGCPVLAIAIGRDTVTR